MNQAELVSGLDSYFNVQAFDERDDLKMFSPGYQSVLERFAIPGFLQSTLNGLMLNNAREVDRVYTIVFPAPQVIDTIIAREVERGAPGALIFCHHISDYQESGAGFSPIGEPLLAELREHQISYYLCHAPLDCHPETSTSTALANALKLRDPERFARYRGGLAGVRGKIGPIGFHELAKRAAEVTGLPMLRYSALRNNGRPVQQVGIVAGDGGTPEYIREAIELGVDTFITGEWWLFGASETRASRRSTIHDFLVSADINLIGTSHYASEAVVMRDQMPDWFRTNTPGIDARFIPQEDPWR